MAVVEEYARPFSVEGGGGDRDGDMFVVNVSVCGIVNGSDNLVGGIVVETSGVLNLNL